MPEAATQQRQILLCGSDAERERAEALFPRLECRYLNGGDWQSIEGRRCVCVGEALAAFAVGFAAEVKFLPDAIPDEILTPSDAMAWAKAHAQLYQNPAQVAVPPSPDGGEAAGKAEPGESSPFMASPDAPAAGPVQDAQADDAPPPFDPDDIAPETLYERRSTVWEPEMRPKAEMGHPADLWGSEATLPQIPPECYPEALRAYVVDEAEVMGCDPGMLALYCIAICAGAVTDEIKVQVKAASDRWQESARIWAMIVGDSGLTMKSPTLDAAISHAWKIERELRVAGSQALKDYATECQIYEAQKADYVKKRSKNEPAELPLEPAPPIAERLIVGNATLEAISEILLTQGERGVLVRADELLGIISGMNQYKGGKGSDRQDWLEMWNGGPHPIDRKGRAVLIKNWAVSIVGGTQPEAIARKGSDLETDGLLQRFTVYLPRHSTHGADREADAEARRRYHDVLDRLPKLTRLPTLAPVRFSPEAAAVITQARQWVFETARASWLSAGLRSHLAKWPAILARLCLTYAAIEAADEHQAAIQPQISADIARQVWGMMRGTLWQHAQHFYLNTLTGDNPSRQAVRQIAGLVLAEGWSAIDARTITQRSSLYRAAQPSERREIIATLCEFGWLHPTGGKSLITGMPTRYEVNKAVHGLYSGIAAMERRDRAERTRSWDTKRALVAATREAGED